MPRQRRDSRFLVFWFSFLSEPIGQISCRAPYYKSLLECNLSPQALHPRNPPLSNALQLLIENQLPICICILRFLVFGRGLKPYSISLSYSSSRLFLVFDNAIFPSRRLPPAAAASPLGGHDFSIISLRIGQGPELLFWEAQSRFSLLLSPTKAEKFQATSSPEIR